MIQKVKGEAPFQVLASNFSIGPSNEGYTLQISADGVNYSNLFAVGANVTRMVTGVANGSYYRLSGNNSDVTVNWRTQCNDGGSGGGSSQYAESAGTANFADISNSTRLLDGIANFPQDANNGDVVAIGEQQTPKNGLKRGTRSLPPSTGIYQYDGSSWNKIETDTTNFTALKPVSELPASGEKGEVVALSSETGETITFNTSDVVFGEGEDILEISGDGLHTLTANAFYDTDNQVDVLKLTNSLDEDYLVEDGSSLMFPASTDDELIWEWMAELNNGVVTIKLYDEDNDAYLPLSTSNISLNVCDAKVNGTFVGVYQYDGSSWNQVGENGEGGDNTILKSVQEEPSNLDNGDAFAQYIVETATTEGVNILAINPAEFSGDWGAYVDEYGGEFGIFCYNGEVLFTTRRYSDPLILHPASDFTEDFYQLLPDDGFDPSDENTSMAEFWVKNDLVEGLVYFAFPSWYSIDITSLPNGITDYGKDDIETGVLTEGVYQKGEKYVSDEVYCVSVSFPNGYENGDTWISGDVSIEVMEWPSEATIVTNAEFLGSRYYFEVGDGDNQIITVYDDNEEKVVFLADGDTDSFTMDGMGTTATCNCSFSDGVFTAEVIKNAVGWENTIFDLIETRVGKQDYNYKLARMEDLPKPIHLLPDSQPNYGYILRYDDKPHWVHPTEITPVLLLNIPTDGQDGDYPTFLMRSDYQDFAWKKLEQNKLEAVAELPLEAESGNVYSLANASGCGIYQAEGSHPENGWYNYEGKTFPQGSVTKIRVPYDDDGESNICRFKTDPNGGGEMSIYWHPENPNDRHWDGLPDGTSQNDGEFTATDPWGNTMTGVKVGNYIEVTFSAPLYNGDGDIYTYRNTEAYSVIAVAEYANAVMSTNINRMVKITQSNYDALVNGGNVDSNTFYVIIEDPQV